MAYLRPYVHFLYLKGEVQDLFWFGKTGLKMGGHVLKLKDSTDEQNIS